MQTHKLPNNLIEVEVEKKRLATEEFFHQNFSRLKSSRLIIKVGRRVLLVLLVLLVRLVHSVCSKARPYSIGQVPIGMPHVKSISSQEFEIKTFSFVCLPHKFVFIKHCYKRCLLSALCIFRFLKNWVNWVKPFLSDGC